MKIIFDILLGGIGVIILALVVSGVILLSLHDPAIIVYIIALPFLWFFGVIIRKILT